MKVKYKVIFDVNTCKLQNILYLCIVFFMVLDY